MTQTIGRPWVGEEVDLRVLATCEAAVGFDLVASRVPRDLHSVRWPQPSRLSGLPFRVALIEHTFEVPDARRGGIKRELVRSKMSMPDLGETPFQCDVLTVRVVNADGGTRNYVDEVPLWLGLLAAPLPAGIHERARQTLQTLATSSEARACMTDFAWNLFAAGTTVGLQPAELQGALGSSLHIQ